MQPVTITPKDRMEKMRQLTLFAQGKQELEQFDDALPNFDFAALEADYKSKEAEAARRPYSKPARTAMIYAYALWRDSKFTYAGRRYLQGVALHNQFRSLYDGAKTAYDSGLEV